MTKLNANSANSLAHVRPDCDVLIVETGCKTPKYIPLAANAALAVLLTGCIAPNVSVNAGNIAPVAVGVGTTTDTEIRGTAIDGTIVDMGTVDIVR